MKIPLIPILLLYSVFLLAWCGNTSIQQDIINQPIINQETETPYTLWISLDSSEYNITDMTEESVQGYNTNLFTIKKITHIPTGKRTYLISHTWSWSDFIQTRESSIFWEVMSITGQTAQEASFDIRYGINNIPRYMVQVPIDRVMLVNESLSHVYILDFDDPSWEQNKMDIEQIDTLIQHLIIE